ncbi:ABC transporter permease [Kitasatospora viridis]|uniref:ABC-2 type transport system permease protein n=1 Tax=Kitasatospora viridis TaxID=281105 RepID=A0A561UKC7_9ACTN|nr:ABC-2 family transporter protein [Kitasatospora viridis]TWF99818.1 ABC-2 type transport system permease protein [Kitasatospora viridis]
MASSAGLYLAIARGGFRRYSTYRAATAAGAFTNTVFGFVLASGFLALWHAKPHLGGYDTRQAVTYIWVSQALLVAVAAWGGGFQDDLQDRFRTGDIALDLHRPCDFLGWWLAGDLGRAAFQLLTRGAVPLTVGVLVGHARLPHSPLTWPLFLGSVLLSLLVSFGIRFLISVSSFWLMDAEGLRAVSVVVSMFLSGMLLPLTLFPDGLRQAAQLLPWAALIQAPCDIFLERGGDRVPAELALQAGWAVLLLAAGRAAQALAARKVVVQGG